MSTDVRTWGVRLFGGLFQRFVTIKAGTNVTITESVVGRESTLTIAASGGGGGGGAPTSAQYVTLATDATLTAERVLTAGHGVDLVDAGAGSTVTLDVNETELDHSAITTGMGWTSSGHTGTASRLAGFSGAGAATYYAIGSDVQAWSATLDAVTAGTYTGSTSITTLGTVATGTWSATAVGETKGGTGQTSYTTGDILYASASNTLSKLPAGTAGASLTMVSGVPAWVVLGVASAIRISSSTNTPLTGGDVYCDNADGNASAFVNATVP